MGILWALHGITATHSHTSSGLNQMRVDGRKEQSFCVINVEQETTLIGTASTGKEAPPSKHWHHQSAPLKADGSHLDNTPDTTNNPLPMLDESQPPPYKFRGARGRNNRKGHYQSFC
eukprot:7724253-Ditylum_brightwellii.AAC.1